MSRPRDCVRVNMVRMLQDWDRIDTERDERTRWRPPDPYKTRNNRIHVAVREVQKLQPLSEPERLAVKLVLEMLRDEQGARTD